MPLCNDPIVERAIAEERLKRLERDYAHSRKNYTETRSQRWHFYSEVYNVKNHCRRTEYRIHDCKRLVEQLQNALDKLSPKATSKGAEADHSLHFLMLHGNKSLAQEKMLLRQKTESQQQEGDYRSQENIDFKWINHELSYLQTIIQKYSEKKPIHELLREVEETKKSGEQAIASGALDGNPASHERLKKSMEEEVKALKKLIGELEKERRETEHICKTARKNLENVEKKMKQQEKEKENLCGRWDEERKRILELKKKLEHEG